MDENKKVVQLLEQLNYKMDKLMDFLEHAGENQQLAVEVSRRVNGAFQRFLSPNGKKEGDKSF